MKSFFQVKSYDLFASIFHCRKLTELRLIATDSHFLTPLKLNYIFLPYTFPAVKKLQLYTSQMPPGGVDLFRKRIFPTVEVLVLDTPFY